ncbi:TPA: hypothetical protein RMI67_005856 [Bacillus cereus]|nr:hypothetical protein [Bacillus cereus]
MIEGVELNIYLDDDDNNSVSLSLSPVQTEVIFKALGLQFHQDRPHHTISGKLYVWTHFTDSVFT